jgi:hypothetical protein
VAQFRFIHILMVLVYWAYVLRINVMNSKETLLDANWHESDKYHYMCVHRQNAHCSCNMKVNSLKMWQNFDTVKGTIKSNLHFKGVRNKLNLRNACCYSVPTFALRYKPEGHGFDSRYCHWNFSLT